MPENIQRCVLCNSKLSRPFDQRTFRSIPVANRMCESCGLVFQSPRMSHAELMEFYSSDYRLLYQGQDDPTPKDLAVQRDRAENLLAFFKPHSPQLESHLDIGSSAGLLLKRFQDEYGTRPAGVEPGRGYRSYMRRHAIPIYASLEEVRQAGIDRFELVSLIHVLEHLDDPLDYLRCIRREFLAEDGWLMLETPNLYAHDCFEVAHLFSFSAHTLQELVRQAGFQVVAVEKHGRPRSLVIPLYISLLARPAATEESAAAQPENGVWLKRKLGMARRRLVTRLMPAKAWLPIKTE